MTKKQRNRLIAAAKIEKNLNMESDFDIQENLARLDELKAIASYGGATDLEIEELEELEQKCLNP
jgi:hypothetical protein